MDWFLYETGLRHERVKDIGLDVMNLIEPSSKSNSNQNTDTDPTDVSPFQQEIIQC